MYESAYTALQNGQRTWIKANFHTHAGICALGHCGILPLGDVIEAYKEAGFKALAITNHDRHISVEKEYEGICVIDGVEYSADPHMLLIGVRDFFDLPRREAIDSTAAAGGFTILCHPNWQYKGYFPDELLDSLDGYAGIEIANAVVNRLSGSGLALDAWDYILSRGKRKWGFGNDDFHLFHDAGRVYNMIYAKSGSFEDIKEAVTEGCFYVSSGVALKEFSLEGDELFVKAGYFRETYINSFEYKLTGAGGRVLCKSEGETLRCKLSGEAYARLEVTSECGAKMYLQPVFKIEN